MTRQLRVLDDPDGDIGATLGLIARARRSLAEARTLPDIRRVMEIASVTVDAAQRGARLAKAQHAAAEVVDAANQAANEAAAIRIEAQARAGELLRLMADRGERGQGGRPAKRSHAATVSGGPDQAEPDDAVPSLADLGVSKSESSRWQAVAAVPAATRQQYVDDTRAARGEVSTAELLKQTRPSVDHQAIAGDARKRMRDVHRLLVALPGYRPESLVAALDVSERRDLLRVVGQLTGWIEDVRRELAIHRVSEEGEQP
jgi:hypothetical protein